jgi:hypothetical protein
MSEKESWSYGQYEREGRDEGKENNAMPSLLSTGEDDDEEETRTNTKRERERERFR